MHSALINSANDKDTAVRVQVAIVLGNLKHCEDFEAIEEGVQSLTDILRNLTQFDPSPDARRAALSDVNMQINKQTLSVLLSRVKDPDATSVVLSSESSNPLLCPLVHFHMNSTPYLFGRSNTSREDRSEQLAR